VRYYAPGIPFRLLQHNSGLDMLYHIWYNMPMNDSLKILPARFFRTVSGTEPVREWLKDLEYESHA
jgi:hypothetical protein